MAYQVNTISTAMSGGSWRKIFGGNSRRVSLVFGGNVLTTVHLANSDRGSGIPGLVVLNLLQPAVFPAYQYGPMVTGEIWLNSFGSALTVVSSEIYRV